ncbi:flippase [Candidatus Shapirobacteria bacterium]|nr:flippase [Candidatus Shapirobacteria bacterium]
MHLSQKVALNTLIQVGTKIITVFFGFLTMVILTRFLGPSGYGDYMYVLTLVVLFGSLADWGTATIGVREASKNTSQQNLILSNIFILRLALAFVACLVMVLAAFFLPLKTANELLVRQGIVLGALILFLFVVKSSFGLIFQTKLQMQKLAWADITASFLIFFITWFFIRFGLNLFFLLLAVVLANLVAVVLAGFLAFKTIIFKFRLRIDFIKNYLKECLPMGAILLLLTVDNKIDTVMLGSLKGSGAVGIYAVAYRFYDVLILGAAYFMNSLLPVLSQFADLKKWGAKIKTIYQKSFEVLFLMGLVAFCLSLFFAPLLVRLVTQERAGEFIDSINVLRILSLAIFLSYFNHLTGFTIVALGRQRWYFLVAFLAVFFNILANFLVIPKFSYFGAALTTVLTEALVLLIAGLFVTRLLKLRPTLLTLPKTIRELVKQKGKIF